MCHVQCSSRHDKLLAVIASELEPRRLFASVAVSRVTTSLGIGGEDWDGNIHTVYCEGELRRLQNRSLGLLNAVRRDRQHNLVVHNRPQSRKV